MKTKIFIAAALMIVIVATVFFMMSRDSKPSTYEIKDGNLTIGGSFGVTVAIPGISELNLTEVSPKIATKTNGAGIGSVYKGEFLINGNAKARLYIDASKPPFIVFRCEDTMYYLNSGTPEQTRELYGKLEEGRK